MPTTSRNTRLAIGALTGSVVGGFGLNAIIRPDHALTFFEWMPPAVRDGANHTLYVNLMFVYGIRDIYAGVVLLVAGLFGNNKTLGGTILATSAMAFGDGYICYLNGKGQWNHWGYAPMLAVLGAWLMS